MQGMGMGAGGGGAMGWAAPSSPHASVPLPLNSLTQLGVQAETVRQLG